MGKYSIEDIKATPYFDMELIMNISQETRLGGDILERLMETWTTWLPELNCKKISTGKPEYLAVWLGQSVEDTIDALWKTSASEAYLFNALAQAMCMGTINTLLPEVEDAGCAPAPKPTDDLKVALGDIGLPYSDKGPALSKRYAVVTHSPFKGACDICCLLKDCPKGQGQGKGAMSIVLSGHEADKA